MKEQSNIFSKLFIGLLGASLLVLIVMEAIADFIFPGELYTLLSNKQ